MTLRLLFLPLLGLLSACNMVISDTPMFADGDRGTAMPRDGLWLGDDADCRFDSDQPESSWPECAVWVVVRDSGRVLLFSGKGESERIGGLFTAGSPAIFQAEWIDKAKEPARPYFAYYAVEPADVGSDGRFTAASVWPVDCGIQEEPNFDIQPFPGISLECRPSSTQAIRSAADASRRARRMEEWQWLRAEAH